ncbi:MAG: RDD family protein [Aureispira sp.]
MDILDDDQLKVASLEELLSVSWYSRLFAGLLDILLFGGLFYSLAFFLIPPYYRSWMVPVFLIGIPVYKIVLEGTIGATLGKKIMGLQVVADEEAYTALTLRQSNRRFLLAWPMCVFPLIVWALDGLYVELTNVGIMSDFLRQIEWVLVFLAIIDGGSYLWSKRQKSWGDHLANTRCIVAKNRLQENY